MTETIYMSTTDPESSVPIPKQEIPSDERQAALNKAGEFLHNQIPALCRLTGMNVRVAIGEGWATDPETGSFTIDPSFFIEKRLFS